VIESILDEMLSYGYLNDEKYITDYIIYRQEQGYGAIRIRYDLQLRGAEREQLDQLMEQVYDHEQDQAAVEAILERRAQRSGESCDDRWLNKQASFLKRRGFGSSAVLKAISKYRNLE